MKASWNWLTDYVPLRAAVAEVAERLTMAGLTVEGIEETPEDFILDVEITSNRPDWLSHLGIAREAAALYGLALKVPQVDLPKPVGKAADEAALEVPAQDLCPLYTGRIIKGVKVGESPDWLKKRIEAIGLRSVNNVVDITNYVMYECGQPLHAFDLALLGGRKVIVRRAKNGEMITLIDGTRHTLHESDLVIADEARPVAVAGVMGGGQSEIGAATEDIFLESAKFDQYSIRRTAKRLGLSSDASYRFERGVDLERVDWGSRRASRMILEVAGGEIAEGVLAVGETSLGRPVVRLRMSRLERLLGVKVPIEEARSILASLGFVLRGGSPDETLCEVPSFRGDVKEEADLVEEVARIYGYDRVPFATGMSIAAGRYTPRQRMVEAAGNVLTSAGFYGCVSYSLVSGGVFEKINPWSGRGLVYLQDRAGHENVFMRPSLLASLLTARKTNEDRKVEDADLYETAHIYLPSEGELPEQPLMVAAVSGADFSAIKGVIEKLLAELGVDDAAFEGAQFPFLEEGRAARIVRGGEMIGYAGILAEGLRAQMDLSERVSIFELRLSGLEQAAHAAAVFEPLKRFPGVERDLAVIVDEGVTWAAILSCIEEAGASFLDHVSFASVYRGDPVPRGAKSIAFHMVFRSPDRTLTGEEADAEQARVVDALSAGLGATLR